MQTYIKDTHGSVIGLAGKNGAKLDTKYDYDAFGNQLYDEPNPFGYCGEYYDSESGNIYLRARYYDSNIGRFVSEDPVKDGMNWYNYCGGNPVNMIDPSGLAPGDEYRDAADFKIIKIQLMKIITNKAYYEEAYTDEQLNGTNREAYKQNLSSWASNERKELMDYMSQEFGGEDLYDFFNDVLCKEGGATIEEVSALLCVVESYEASIDVSGNDISNNMSYGELYNIYDKFKQYHVVYYVDVANAYYNFNDANTIDITSIGRAYMYPNNSRMEGGKMKDIDPLTGMYKIFKLAFALNDQDDKTYAPESI